LKLAKLVGDITKLDKAYSAKSELQTRLKKALTVEKVTEKNVKRLKKKVEQYGDVDKLSEVVVKMGQVENKRRILISELEELEEAEKHLNTLEPHINAVRLAIEKLDYIIRNMIQVNRDIKKNAEVYDDLKTAYTTVVKVRRTAEELEEANSAFKTSLKEAGICPTCERPTDDM
jgi:DNA repair exonuclease SbcCD ATPase subunit